MTPEGIKFRGLEPNEIHAMAAFSPKFQMELVIWTINEKARQINTKEINAGRKYDLRDLVNGYYGGDRSRARAYTKGLQACLDCFKQGGRPKACYDRMSATRPKP